MRIALWPNYEPAQIDGEIAKYQADARITGHAGTVFVADRTNGKLCGFVEVGLRPFAHGCSSSPVGYIEGWYVDDDVRRQGVGRALLQAAEQWARQQGCTEVASDCLDDNDVSYLSHLRLEYEPTVDHILFRKSLGGAAPADRDDWIEIVPDDLRVETAVKLVTDPRAGGIDVFLGTTRAEKSDDGRELLALDYEAYEEMATDQLRKLAQRARQKWPIIKLAILHRTGRVKLGEASVIIAVSTPHRADAFEACRFIIDQLKVDVAIWKKEVWSDGTGCWVHPTTAHGADSSSSSRTQS
jgi:molybdopterin synthase catalytic subunit